jgi:2,3-bisphosphoglycerate-dependent phosphoglycerate mutase
VNLLIIRHGEPHREARTDGRPADPSLTSRGQAQAQRLIDWLVDEPIDAIWSSPMARARETAAPLAEHRGIEILVDERLAEYDRSSSEYTPVEVLKAEGDARYLALAHGDLSAYGIDGEEFIAEVAGAFEAIVATHPSQTVAVFCHGGVVNAYLTHVLQTPKRFWLDLPYTAICRLTASRHGPRSVRSLGEVAHLRGTDLL